MKDWEKSRRFEKIEMIRDRERKKRETPKIESEKDIENGQRWNRWREEKGKEKEKEKVGLKNDSLLPDGWKVQVEDTDQIQPVRVVESSKPAKEKNDDSLLPDGWKLQVGDEDLHHPEGVVEMEKNTDEVVEILCPVKEENVDYLDSVTEKEERKICQKTSEN